MKMKVLLSVIVFTLYTVSVSDVTVESVLGFSISSAFGR